MYYTNIIFKKIVKVKANFISEAELFLFVPNLLIMIKLP